MRRAKLLLGVMILSGFGRVEAQAVAPNAAAQTSIQPAAATLESLAQQTAAYRKVVPNFTCEENAVSSAIRGGKLKLRIEFTATLRVVRATDGDLAENFHFTSYMGRPTTEGGKYPLPLYVGGLLSGGMPSFFDASQQSCFHYTEGDRRIEFESQPGDDPACADKKGITGFVTLDEHGSVLHEEIHRPAKEAAERKLVRAGAIDYDVVRLNHQDYRLPVHVYAENPKGFAFEANLTGCRLFQATVTITPAQPMVVDGAN